MKIKTYCILLLFCIGLLAGCNKTVPEVSEPTGTAAPIEETNAPEVTKVPEVTKAPEATKVPEVTKASEVTEAPKATATPEPTKRPVPPMGELTGCSAEELTKMMTIGWNLGNTLESTGDQVTFDSEPKKAVTAWGNEEPTKELFEAVKAAGFDTVRIPITWYQHMKYDSEEGHYVINEKWLEYVKNTVDYAYELDLFVMINVHHEDWVNAPKFTEESYATAEQMMTEIWTTAADMFEDYDQHLIFESMNEPRQTGLGSTVEWGTGDDNSRKYINNLNQVMVNAVRGQGSAANKERLIMLPGYAASNNTDTLNAIVIPENGGNIAISVHAYYPYFFAADTSDKANHEFPGKSGYGEDYEAAINSMFPKLKAVSERKGVPVIMGECGASDFNNTDSRVRWATFFLTKAKEAGIVCAFWDNQAIYNGTGEAYGLLCRSDYTWFENSAPVVEAIMKVYGREIELPVHVTAVQKAFDWSDIPVTKDWVEIYRSEQGEELAAWGNTWLENWQPYIAPEYDIILIYQSDSEPYMVLQGGWHKVYSEEGEKHPYMRRFTFHDVTETMTAEGVKLEDMTGYFASASQSTMKLYGVYAVPAALRADAGDIAANEPEKGEAAVIPTEENVRVIGRTYMQKDTLWMALSGSGAEFSVTGTKASVIMKADSSARGDESNHTRVAVYLDGIRVADKMLSKAETTIPVFESEEEETHTVRVIKLSESAMSTCGISEIIVNGQVSPTEPKEKLIEFVGDSITCGYGVDDEDRDHHFATGTEDVTKAYAYKTAENLGADYSMVSFSGYGIVSGFTGNGEKSGEQLVPMYYEKLGFSYGTYLGDGSPQAVDWEFSKRQPDLIVINLGTNDNSYVQGKADRKEEYINGYVEFLKTVRKCNPNATILCTLGIMGTDLCPAVEETVARYQNETGDKNVYSMRFAAQLPSDGYAADWHPTEATHEKAATKLTAEIKKIMGN
ncbi:MAG: cellulase family glycosylhydrolase [Lachnospiraceae bacterium]|nr:cellulase family glycosylhydrolase [Lachnospiraceae bacterium]